MILLLFECAEKRRGSFFFEIYTEINEEEGKFGNLRIPIPKLKILLGVMDKIWRG